MTKKLIKVVIPKRLSLLDTICIVKYGGDTDKKLAEDHHYGCYQSSRRGTREILLDSTQYEGEFHSTFIHELLEYCSAVLTQQTIPHSKLEAMGKGLSVLFKQMGIVFIKENDG